MAEATISFAVETLGNLLIQKAIFLKGVEEQVGWLKNELKRMQCFLKDAVEKQANDERVRKWISEIREVAHDAEDAIETFILKVEDPRRSRSGPLGSCACLPTHISLLNRVGEEIESIRKRIQEIERSRLTYGIQSLGEGMDSSRRRSEDIERRRRLSTWEKEDTGVVGLNEDVEQLLQELILKEEKGLCIAAIVGMGGIGKSTLARKIYNHAAVAARFEYRGWVVVSSEFTPEETIKQILLELQNSKEGREEVLKDTKELEAYTKDRLFLQEKLQEMLHTNLKGKQYFIVLDDVWEQMHWESLRRAFPDEQDKTSRLLFTSRNQSITKHHGYIHKMRCLDPDESWELLLKMAFIGKTDGKCPQDLENIGRGILEKCHGLPLAIAVAGGMLASYGESKIGWERVLRQIKNYHLETSEIGTNVSAILELSYRNLPPQRKACFLFLGFFKEDAIIRARRLVHIWVSQGCISSEEVGGEETMEEIARDYLDELINRNLVQVKDIHLDGRVKTFCVHDLLRELSIRKAKEEIGFEILREEGNSSTSSCKSRHRAAYYSGARPMIDSSSQSKHLRSLLLHVEGRNDVYIRPSYWKSFELLISLDLEGTSFERFPSAFRALIGLKYLRLVNTYGPDKLPSWLNHLKNLEILELVGQVVELPNSKWKMDSLRHFYADSIYGTLKMDTWENLETLKYITSDYLMSDHPKQMATCRLRKLGVSVSNLSRTSCILNSLEKMENLARLDLEWEMVVSEVDGPIPFRDPCPAACSMFPKNLSHLTLSRVMIRLEDPMPVLGKLPKLMYLKLSTVWGEGMRVLADGFPRLQVLSLHYMPDVSFIYMEDGGMPVLERLEIRYCPHLQTQNLQEHLRSAAITSTN